MILSRLSCCLVVVFSALVLATAAAAANERYVMISHAPDNDDWWDVIRNGLALAAAQVDVTVDYRNPPDGDLHEMARLIDEVAATDPDAIITTLADPDILGPAIARAVGRGVDVVVINSGEPNLARELGALTYIGQSEYDAAIIAGWRAKDAGVTSFVCVNHQITSPFLRERCQGFADGLEVPLGDRMLDASSDPETIRARVSAWLAEHPDTDAVITLGPLSAVGTIRALQDGGMAGKLHFGSFDVGPPILQGLRAGVIDWAIDQQPLLQAYMPVVILANYHRYGVLPPLDLATGPGFVTAENLDQLIELSGEYR